MKSEFLNNSKNSGEGRGGADYIWILSMSSVCFFTILYEKIHVKECVIHQYLGPLVAIQKAACALKGQTASHFIAICPTNWILALKNI